VAQDTSLRSVQEHGMAARLQSYGGVHMSLDYKNLVVWRRADDLFIEIHHLTHQRFPREERYELGGQMRRAALSVPSNVVEGNARHTTRDKLKFFNIASASLSELTYGLHAAHRLGYIDPTDYQRLDDLARMVAAPLYGLIRRQRAKLATKTVGSLTVFVMLMSPLLT
jgi:four helix bundle protein